MGTEEKRTPAKRSRAAVSTQELLTTISSDPNWVYAATGVPPPTYFDYSTPHSHLWGGQHPPTYGVPYPPRYPPAVVCAPSVFPTPTAAQTNADVEGPKGTTTGGEVGDGAKAASGSGNDGASQRFVNKKRPRHECCSTEVVITKMTEKMQEIQEGLQQIGDNIVYKVVAALAEGGFRSQTNAHIGFPAEPHLRMQKGTNAAAGSSRGGPTRYNEEKDEAYKLFDFDSPDFIGTVNLADLATFPPIREWQSSTTRAPLSATGGTAAAAGSFGGSPHNDRV